MLATLVALLGLGLTPGSASAHAQLVGTDPGENSVLASAPSTVTFTFNEAIKSVPDAVRLYAADGSEQRPAARSVDDKLVINLPTLGHGTAVVSWRVVSTDGHPIAGALTFSVGSASTRAAPAATVGPTTSRTVDVALGMVQALVYIGLFLVVGLVVFLGLFLPRSGVDDVRGPLLRIARVGAAVTVAAAVLLLPVTTVRQRGESLDAVFSAAAWHLDLSTSDPWAALILVVGVAVCLVTATRAPVGLAGLAAGGIALASLVLVGHTRTHGPAILIVSADLVHVLAGSVWLGGLVGLAVSLRRLADRPALAAQTLSRFSTVAAGLLAAVGVTGTVLAWRILGSWGGFVHTSFGRALLVKLGIVSVVLVLAALNRFRLLPAVVAQSAGPSAQQAIGRVRRVARIEGLLLIAVLAVTGVLVDRSPEPATTSTSAALRPTTEAVGEAVGVKVLLHFGTAHVGSNTVMVELTDPAGQRLVPIDTPTVSFRHGDLELGDQQVLDHGSYFHVQVTLPTAGSWKARVAVPIDEFTNQVIDIPITVGP